MLAETKRMLTPMLSIDLHGRLMIPMIHNPSSATTASIVNTVTNWLDYIDVTLANSASTFTSFLPFPMSEMNPWGFNPDPSLDADRDSGWFNSNVKEIDTFGDTGDPTNTVSTLCDEAGVNSCIYYTRHTQPIWSEIKMASIFRLTDDVTDDEFQLITPHRYRKAILLDDVFDNFDYDGSQVLAASVGFRYIEFVNCRYASEDVAYGTQKPGLIGAEIQQYPLNRMMRLETSYVWSLTVMKAVTAQMTGASIRELRYTIKALIVDSVREGV
jgi:hypothetical protein